MAWKMGEEKNRGGVGRLKVEEKEILLLFLLVYEYYDECYYFCYGVSGRSIMFATFARCFERFLLGGGEQSSRKRVRMRSLGQAGGGSLVRGGTLLSLIFDKSVSWCICASRVIFWIERLHDPRTICIQYY